MGNRSNRLFAGLLGLAIVYLGALALPARADTVYTYTGNPFTTFVGGLSCPPECHITGEFTVVQPLAANLGNVSVSPSSFSFTDGNVTLTDASTGYTQAPLFLFFSTDATGAITSWDVFLLTSTYHIQTDNDSSGGTLFQYDVSGFGVGSGANIAIESGNPGSWSISSTTVPEPSSLLLVGTGLLCLGPLLRRRIQSV
jgi:hypothetical protein